MTTKVFSFTIACLRVALFFTFIGNANGNFSNDVSGGMFNQQSSPSVTNCSFFSNSATNISEGATYTFPLTVTEPAYSQALFSGTTNVSVGTMPPSVANRDFNGNIWPDFATANIFSATAAPPARIYVRASAGGANNGTSWANAYTSLQSALDAAVSGDEIWVAAGTYTPTKDRNGNASPADPRLKLFYINKDLKIYGGFAGTESSLANRPKPLAASIIDGDLGTVGVNTDNAYRCVFLYNVSAASVFDGFTLQNGNANHPSDGIYQRGGGIFTWLSTGNNISNCTFISNYAGWGGGIACESATPVITNCRFSNNTASSRGGGIFTLQSDALIYNCTFTGNSSPLGSGIFNESSAAQVINCSVVGNTGASGIANFGSTPVITNTIVWGNSSQIVNFSGTNPTVTYCIVQGGYSGIANSSQDPLFISSSDLRLQSCSPAIDAGNDGANTTTGDPDFNARKFEAVPGGAQIDRGAYEYQSTVPAPVASCKNVSVNLNGSGTVSVNASTLNNTSTGCGLGFTVGGNASISYICANTGSNTATLTVTDLHGRTSTCNATVTVVDQTAPSIICPANTNVVAGVNCTATLASYTGAATANDNCTANPNKMQSPVSGTVITGSQVVTLTASDGSNNSTACTFTVTVVDQTAPSIICPANTNVVAGVNCTATLASYTGAATANDNCTANPNKAQSPVSGTTITGSQVITLTATDGANNSTACTFTVTVVDQTAPSIICPANTNVVAGVNCTATLASYTGAATANDNCTANPNKMQSPVSGTTITGSQVVTLTASDGSNNSTACTFTVTVVDQTAPSIICPANTNVVAGVNCTATLASYTGAATANDNCTANPNKMQSPVSGTTITGSQVVTLTATDGANNSASCTFTVTVVDQTAPSIICPANTNVVAGANCTATLASYTAATTANDNCTANPNKMQSPVSGTTITGSQVVTLTATDGASNSATCSFSVTVVDATPPTVICKNFTANLNTSGAASITTANVFQSGSDNCNTVNLVSVLPNTFTCANKGANIVELTVSDGSSNTSTCSAIVTVADATAPTIICPANIIRATDLNQCTASVVYATPIASDNCAGAVASHFSGGVSGAVFQKGTTTVIWRATDGVGLTSSCSFSITINDTQKPNITCPANQTRSTDPGLCSAVVTYPTPKGTDNCGLPMGQPMWISGGTTPVVSGANSIATFQKGINTVTWRATDGTGLTNTCTFRVTVNDTEAPALTCPAAMNLFTATNTCNATATYTNPSFTDNCAPTTGTAVRISGLVSGSTFPLGNSNVVFQATDAAGNTRRCTMVVTVTDNQPPVITCPAPVVVNGTGSPCVATVFYGSATASDNCAGTLTPFLVTGLASGSSFPTGVTTNTFRAVAPNGQSSNCSFSVTVNCGSGMGNTGTEVRDADLDISQNNNLDLTLAPNPALSTVTVSIDGVGAGGGTLLVFDAVGRLVLRQVIAENQRTAVFQVDDSAFAPGLYRVNLRATNGIVTKTLVVVK